MAKQGPPRTRKQTRPPAHLRRDGDLDEPFEAPTQTARLDVDDLCHKPSRKVGSLLIIAGTPADIGKHVLIEDDTTVIGRTTEGLHLRDGNISRRHATVERQDTGYYVTDLGSTNGTLLNGSRLHEPTELADGDTIVLGQTVLKFQMVDETEASYHHQAQRKATTDDITGLSVKRHYDAVFQQAVSDAHSMGRPLCAMVMEIDTLKPIIGQMGRNVGEAVVRDVAGIIKSTMANRVGSSCYLGGGEYSAFLIGAPLSEAMAVAEAIRGDVERGPLAASLAEVTATISIGVAKLPPKASDMGALLRLADDALYRARTQGRNRVSD